MSQTAAGRYQSEAILATVMAAQMQGAYAIRVDSVWHRHKYRVRAFARLDGCMWVVRLDHTVDTHGE